MALTEYQIEILRLLSDRRKREGVSYVAGGAALNQLLKTERRSRDLDLFHDTTEALAATWAADRSALLSAGYDVEVLRELPSFVEAEVIRGPHRVLVQWLRDSAFRFFPVIEDNILGLTLHPFDLATNKVLALVGRLEPRDWIDTIECHRSLQPLGYLAWAACGKDPGVCPDMIFSEAARLHYSQIEIDGLDFGPNVPSAARLSAEWKDAIAAGRMIVGMLPEEHLGKCVMAADQNSIYRGAADRLENDLCQGNLAFHEGSIGGAWPRVGPLS